MHSVPVVQETHASLDLRHAWSSDSQSQTTRKLLCWRWGWSTRIAEIASILHLAFFQICVEDARLRGFLPVSMTEFILTKHDSRQPDTCVEFTNYETDC